MAYDINTIFGIGIDPMQSQQALADRLSRQQRAGMALGLSTLDPVRQLGQNLQSGAVESAKEGARLRQAMAKQQREQQQKNKPKPLTFGDYQTYQDPETGQIYQITQKGGETFAQDEQGNPLKQSIQGFIPYEQPKSTGGSSPKPSKSELKQQQTQQSELASKDLVGQLLTSPFMPSATGPMIDVTTAFPKVFGIGPQAGSLQADLSGLTVQQAAMPLSYLGVNPTDKDLDFALAATRTLGSSWLAWRDWYKNQYAPKILSYIRNQPATDNNGNPLTPEQREDAANKWIEQSASVVAKMDRMIKAEDSKSWTQKGKEIFNPELVEDSALRQEVPPGIPEDAWLGLSDEDRKFYMENKDLIDIGGLQ